MLEKAFAEKSGAKTTYADIKLVASQVSSSVGHLHDHFLSSDGSACEGEFIACTAPTCLASTGDVDSCISVGKVVIDCPRRFIGAF